MTHPTLQALTVTATTLTACLNQETAAVALQNWAAMTDALEAKREAIRQFEQAWATATRLTGFDQAQLAHTLRPLWDQLDRAVTDNRKGLARAISTQDAVIATVLHALDEDPSFMTYGTPQNKPVRAVALATRA
jgi:AcrR family transcriptional regulator